MFPHRDASGRVLGVYVVVTDITQRKLSERADRRERGEVPRHRQQRAGADVGDRSRRPARIRQPGLSRFLRRLLRGGARVRLAQGPPSRRSAAHSPGGARNRRVGEVGHGRGPLPARRRPVAVAAGGIAAALGPGRGEHVGFIGVAHDVTDAKRAQDELARINETLERRVAGADRPARGERSAGADLLPALARMPRGARRGRRAASASRRSIRRRSVSTA